jgi:hypothetical protein
MATLKLPAEELERRRRNAEDRQKNRGPRQKPYQPRNAGKLKVRKKKPRTPAQNADRASREVSVRFPTTEMKELVRDAATRVIDLMRRPTCDTHAIRSTAIRPSTSRNGW